MSIFEWSDSFLVRVPQIDEHHKQLVLLLNRAYDSFMGNAPTAELTILIDELIQYTVYHFEAEELLMEEYGYPHLENHKEGHDNLKKSVLELYAALHDGNKAIDLEVLQLLKNWLVSHILMSDKDIGLFISSTSVC